MKPNPAQLTFALTRPEPPVREPMARRADMETSREAAAVVEPHLGKIQREVLEAYRAHGPMTARDLEALPEFSEYGFSTVRKRLSELARAGHLVPHGTDRSGRAAITIWRLA